MKLDATGAKAVGAVVLVVVPSGGCVATVEPLVDPVVVVVGVWGVCRGVDEDVDGLVMAQPVNTAAGIMAAATVVSRRMSTGSSRSGPLSRCHNAGALRIEMSGIAHDGDRTVPRHGGRLLVALELVDRQRPSTTVDQGVVAAFILMTPNMAPAGSARMAKRPGGMSVAATMAVAPSFSAAATVAWVSVTAK